MDKHIHTLSNLRGSGMTKESESILYIALLLLVFVVAGEIVYYYYTRVKPILIAEHVEPPAKYIEPVGASTSVNLGTPTPNILQKITPIRKNKSRDPLDIV